MMNSVGGEQCEKIGYVVRIFDVLENNGPVVSSKGIAILASGLLRVLKPAIITLKATF
jgi:hypothetical protein